MKKRQEEFSRFSFSSWLDMRMPAEHVVWHEVDPVDEPPDWYLEVASNRFAIEATSVVDHLWEFDPPLSSYAISASLSNFVDRIEEEAKSKGPLNGVYIVTLVPIRNFRKHEQWLFDELMAYIDRTRDQSSADEYRLGKIGFRTLSIWKFESERNSVAAAISYGGKFEGQAMDDLRKLVSAILEKKSHLLRDLRDPVILLLLDAFQYSTIVDWKDVISEMRVPSIFEAVFRTHTEYPAQLLYTQSDFWQQGINGASMDA